MAAPTHSTIIRAQRRARPLALKGVLDPPLLVETAMCAAEASSPHEDGRGGSQTPSRTGSGPAPTSPTREACAVCRRVLGATRGGFLAPRMSSVREGVGLGMRCEVLSARFDYAASPLRSARAILSARSREQAAGSRKLEAGSERLLSAGTPVGAKWNLPGSRFPSFHSGQASRRSE